jgi:hypothetical protein
MFRIFCTAIRKTLMSVATITATQACPVGQIEPDPKTLAEYLTRGNIDLFTLAMLL